MALTWLPEENTSSHANLLRWGISLLMVLALHGGVSFAILRNLETTSASAAPPAMIMIDLPVEALLPQADSVQSIAADEVAEVNPAEPVEASPPVPEELIDETLEVEEETPIEEAPEEPTEPMEEVKPSEVSDTAPVVAEIVPPEEVVKAEPVEEPKAAPPKPRKKPPPPKRSASRSSVNSTAAAGAGRSNPQALSRYLSQVRATILRNRRAAPAGAYGKVTVQVTITKSGRLSGIGVARSSGKAALDRAALATVRGVGRVKAIPAETGRSSILLNIPFEFARR